MSLHDYLSKYFPNGSTGEFEGVAVNLVDHFFEKFGVNVKNEGDLYQLKYDMLAAKFSFPLVKECRGHIWRYDGAWTRVCTPPDKFFNQHEGYCPIFNDVEFSQKLSSLSAIRKEDGTAIAVWYDSVRSAWRASTLGAITPFKVGDYTITFDVLFWKTLGEENKNILETQGDKNVTYLFELCCLENRIVTKYITDRTFLLTARNNKTGVYETPIWWDTFKAYKPDFFLLAGEDNIKTLDDLKRWVDKQSDDTADAVYREGFVVYDGLTPIAKLKTARYLSLHAVGGGDMKHTRNVVIDSFFAGTLDDIWGVLHPQMQEFAEKLKDKVIKLTNEALAASKNIDPSTIATQKDYALWIKANVPPMFAGFFFQNKEAVLAKKGITEDFTWWVKANYRKFEGVWKE